MPVSIPTLISFSQQGEGARKSLGGTRSHTRNKGPPAFGGGGGGWDRGVLANTQTPRGCGFDHYYNSQLLTNEIRAGRGPETELLWSGECPGPRHYRVCCLITVFWFGSSKGCGWREKKKREESALAVRKQKLDGENHHHHH